MGKAGQSLKQVLQSHGVSQYSLAQKLGMERTNVYRWVHEIRDPTAESVVDIVLALKELNPAAAKEFVRLYLGTLVEDIKSNQQGQSDSSTFTPPQASMSKRVNINIPNAVYEDLEAWAESEGRTVANLVAFLVETEVRSAKKQGKIQTQNDNKK
ncbi:MAG: helix-turn-helix domain-containing protein [Cyanobacteriota bacterium]|nr:helix-turn-helix domain-containing protein [Cyanobacteriota bacterium]